MKAQPIRTCLGCQKRFPKKELMKYVLVKGIVVHDSRRTGQGRSAYCCNNNICLEIFFKQKKKLSRAFRVQDGQISFYVEGLGVKNEQNQGI